MKEQLQIPDIEPDVVRTVMSKPRAFCQAVLLLAEVDLTKDTRTAEELERMRLCRDSLKLLIESRERHITDMEHNALAGVKPLKSPYFAS
jgi:hypothetical protein